MVKGTEVARRTMSKAVADVLREEILQGDLPPGTRLMQSDIAARLGVSTTPVREALTKLEGEGLIVIDQHRGAIVFRPTMEDFRECFEVRELLESLAISKAMPHVTPEVLDRLQSMVDEMKATVDRNRLVELNNGFHLALYELANKPRLLKLIAGLRDATAVYIHMLSAARLRDHGDVHQEHEHILDACRAGDIEAGVQAVREHLWRPVGEVLQASDGSGDFFLDGLFTQPRT